MLPQYIYIDFKKIDLIPKKQIQFQVEKRLKIFKKILIKDQDILQFRHILPWLFLHPVSHYLPNGSFQISVLRFLFWLHVARELLFFSVDDQLMTPVVLSSEHGSPQDCNPAQLQMLPGTEQGYKISKNHSVYRGSNNPTDTTTPKGL